VEPGGALPPGEYAFDEWYCDDLACDCRRALLRIGPRDSSGPVLASIRFGWEKPAFSTNSDPDASRRLTAGCLDPINQKSAVAPTMLQVFQSVVADDEFRRHLRRRYSKFRAALRAAG